MPDFDELLGDDTKEEPKPQVDFAVAKAEAEAAAEADRAKRAEAQRRRHTEHDMKAAELRAKYNLKDPNEKEPKKSGIKGALARSLSRDKAGEAAAKGSESLAEPEHRRRATTPDPTTDGGVATKDKWYKKLFK